MIKKYTTANGETRYMLKTYLGVDPLTGKQKRTTRRGFKSKKEAKQAEFLLQSQAEEQEFTKIYEDYTFEEIAKMWMDSYKSTVKPTTLATAKYMLKTVIKYFDGMKIKNITVLICQNNVQKIQDKYKSSSLLFSVIKRIFKYAYHLEIIPENPMDKVIIPRKKYTEENQEEQIDNFYTRMELLEFLNKCQNSRSPFNVTFFHVLGYTGLRKGEALGLKWKDIDFQNKTLKVSRTAVKVDGKQFCQSPKTKKSRRTISIDDHTISLLKTWKIYQMKRFMAHGVKFEGNEQYIFTNRDCKWYSYNHISDLNNVLAKRFNMRRITIHGFRHTHCSLLFESGATIKEVQERLGHSNIKTTMEIYAHVTEERHEQVANRFNEYMSERKEA